MPRSLARPIRRLAALLTCCAALSLSPSPAQSPFAEVERLGLVADLVAVDAGLGTTMTLGSLAHLAELPPLPAATAALPIEAAGSLVLPLAEFQDLVETLAARGRPTLLDARPSAPAVPGTLASRSGIRLLEPDAELPPLAEREDTARLLLLRQRSARDLTRDLELVFDPLLTGLRCTPRPDIGALLLEGPEDLLDAVMPLARHLDQQPDADRHRLHPVDLLIDRHVVRTYGTSADELDFKALAALTGRVLGREIGFDGAVEAPRSHIVGSVRAPRDRVFLLLRLLGMAAGHAAVVKGPAADSEVEFWDLNALREPPARLVHPRTLLDGVPSDAGPVITWWTVDPGDGTRPAPSTPLAAADIRIRSIDSSTVILTGPAPHVRDALRHLRR